MAIEATVHTLGYHIVPEKNAIYTFTGKISNKKRVVQMPALERVGL